MVQETCVLPIKCKGCSTIFDLWYDLEGKDAAAVVVFGDEDTERYVNQSFCWKCRQAVLIGLNCKEEDYMPEEASEYEVSYE